MKYKDLDHGSTVVVCTNRSELMYVIEYAKSKNKYVSSYMELRVHFPYCLSVSGYVVGWTDEMDRALYYMPFDEFATKSKGL